jgi:hypothetical protein
MYSPKRRFQLYRNPAYSGVVTTNLTLYLDPVYAQSYPGTGNTYTDLSPARNNFTRSTGTFVSSPVKSFSGGVFTRANFLQTDVTIQAWINTTGVGTGTFHYLQMQILSAESGGSVTNPTDFGFGINSGGKLGFGTGSSDATIVTDTSVNTGAWLNVAATRTGAGAIRLFINGVLVKSGTGDTNAGALTSQPTITLGGGDDGGTNWTGLMGSVLVYNAALTESQLLTNFNAQRAAYGV